ncbi:MAG TPA: histidinol dehydrogenase [Candidatus Limnocylindria bacterium]|nr:histidinol dehydrogenase [Candidatus Limnocylindria bacterium]
MDRGSATAPAMLRRDDWDAIDPNDRLQWIAALRAPTPDADAAAIVARVRREGDAALRTLSREIDGVEIDELFVPESEINAASDRVPLELQRALQASATAVRRFHADQLAALNSERRVRTAPGVIAWRRWSPIRRAGGYVPGGIARYPSSVIMLGVPAALAAVDELILATPPGPDGTVDAAVLYAASLVGVRRILRVGGAQAIAALAYGTGTVPRVDRIFGAGNAWVTAAKRLVAADVAIDLPAGPSECVIVADAAADPSLVAADLLAQAEHGPDALAVLVTDAFALPDAVERELATQAAALATGDRALATLRAWGRCVRVRDLEAAAELADAIAPEHLSFQCRDAEAFAERIRAAGAIFIGPWAAVAAGDYASGTNHILPTGGAARAFGGVAVESFGRWVEVQRVTHAGIRRLAPIVEAIAGAEGLPAHAASVRLRAERPGPAGPPVGEDPVELLRRPGPVLAYPSEAPDDVLAALLGVSPHQLARHDLNTMGGGPLPAAAQAIRSYDPARAVAYGDMGYRQLRAALGERHRVDGRRIVPGAGADELIRLVATATLGQGDAALLPTPSFGMFAVETRLAGARPIELPRRELAQRQTPGQLRAAAEREAVRLVWLCSPNNPTGDRYALEEVRALAAGLPAIVLVDEVYLEFAEADTGEQPDSASAIRIQEELPNVIVLRSLSKSHGMAGARVGYLVVPTALVERFDAIRLPLSVSGPAEAIALGVLADEGPAAQRRGEMVAERRRLAAALEASGCRTLPSVTNFVSFRPPDAAALARALAERGMILRSYEAGPMTGWLRANALDRQRTDALIAALRDLLT